MERLSNDILILIKRAKTEINDFNIVIDKTIVQFSEYPTIAGFPFSILVFKSKEGKVKSMLRQWDTAYDMKRWENGIYNLDRLRIITHTHEFLASEIEALNVELSSLENHRLPKDIANASAIAIDGSDFELVIQTKPVINYKWSVATNKINLFIPLIELIKSFHKQKIKNYA